MTLLTSLRMMTMRADRRGVCEHNRSRPHAVTEYTRSGLLTRSCPGRDFRLLPEIPVEVRKGGGEE